jgi:hypothetical protein
MEESMPVKIVVSYFAAGKPSRIDSGSVCFKNEAVYCC